MVFRYSANEAMTLVTMTYELFLMPSETGGDLIYGRHASQLQATAFGPFADDQMRKVDSLSSFRHPLST